MHLVNSGTFTMIAGSAKIAFDSKYWIIVQHKALKNLVDIDTYSCPSTTVTFCTTFWSSC